MNLILEQKKLIVFQMEFDKTKWSCWWNSAEIWLSYHLHVHIDIMLCLKGRVLRLGKTVHKTLPGALKQCLKLDHMQLLLIRSLQDLQENYFKSFFVCLQLHLWCQCSQFSIILAQNEVSDNIGF